MRKFECFMHFLILDQYRTANLPGGIGTKVAVAPQSTRF